MNNTLDFLISEAKSESAETYNRLLESGKLRGIEIEELKVEINRLISFNVDYTNKTLEKYHLHDLLPLSAEQNVFCADSLSDELSEVIWLKDGYSIEEQYWQLVEDNISKILNSYPVLFSSVANIDLNYYIKIDPERTILHDHVLNSFEDFNSFQREYLFKPKQLIGSNLCNIYRIRIKNEEKFIIVVELNHIISDGWSMEVLRSKVLSECQTSDKIHLKFLNVIASRRTTGMSVEAIYDQAKNTKDLQIEYSEHSINGTRFDIIQKFCADMGISTFTLFYSLLVLAEYKMSSKKAISIGSAVNGRDNSDLEDEVFCFIRFIQLTCFIENQTLIEFLRANHSETQKSVLADSALTKDDIGTYHLILILHNFNKASNKEIGHAKVELFSSSQSTDYVTYNIWQDEKSNLFTIKLDYPKFQFESEYVNTLTACFVKLINCFEINLNTKIHDLCTS